VSVKMKMGKVLSATWLIVYNEMEENDVCSVLLLSKVSGVDSKTMP